MVSKSASKNCSLIYESYCFDIIKSFEAEYIQALIARPWQKKKKYIV